MGQVDSRAVLIATGPSALLAHRGAMLVLSLSLYYRSKSACIDLSILVGKPLTVRIRICKNIQQWSFSALVNDNSANLSRCWSSAEHCRASQLPVATMAGIFAVQPEPSASNLRVSLLGFLQPVGGGHFPRVFSSLEEQPGGVASPSGGAWCLH